MYEWVKYCLSVMRGVYMDVRGRRITLEAKKKSFNKEITKASTYHTLYPIWTQVNV